MDVILLDLNLFVFKQEDQVETLLFLVLQQVEQLRLQRVIQEIHLEELLTNGEVLKELAQVLKQVFQYVVHLLIKEEVLMVDLVQHQKEV